MGQSCGCDSHVACEEMFPVHRSTWHVCVQGKNKIENKLGQDKKSESNGFYFGRVCESLCFVLMRDNACGVVRV